MSPTSITSSRLHACRMLLRARIRLSQMELNAFIIHVSRLTSTQDLATIIRWLRLDLCKICSVCSVWWTVVVRSAFSPSGHTLGTSNSPMRGRWLSAVSRVLFCAQEKLGERLTGHEDFNQRKRYFVELYLRRSAITSKIGLENR